jgi:hypothetical protein
MKKAKPVAKKLDKEVAVPEEKVVAIDQIPPAAESISEEGYLEVMQTIVGKQTFEPKIIKIRPFVTTPARVSIHAKRHVPLGPNEGNITVAVDFSVPCYKEEIGLVYKQVDELVDKIMERKLQNMNLVNTNG